MTPAPADWRRALPTDAPPVTPKKSAQKVWRVAQYDGEAVAHLARQAEIDPIIAQLLWNRGIRTGDEAARFLKSPLNLLHPNDSLPGLTKAVEIIHGAIKAGKRICIYGDYDVDGVTGTSILWGLLHRLGVAVEYYVPHRLEEGYGLNSDALKQLADNGVQMVVTVDCGIASLTEADEAIRLGIELVVTDHHEMKSTLPNALAIVHPRLPGHDYPFGGLSGAGVAFKVAWALAVKHCGSEKVSDHLREYLLQAVCLATLGLVADVVPLLDENRILVKRGLAILSKTPPLGIQKLMEVSQLSADKPVRAEDIGFKLAPRINAAGRLGCARFVVDLLTTNDPSRAQELANILDQQNKDRQTREREMAQVAQEMVEAEPWTEQAAIVLFREASLSWHPGVIGIVAGRLVERYGRPTLLLAYHEEKGTLAGSGRSIRGFALHEALKACEVDLLAHGGHDMAAGLRLNRPNFESFRDRFQAYAATHFPKGLPPAPILEIDAELPLQSFNVKLIQNIDQLEPYGAANPRPKFLIGPVKLSNLRCMGQGNRHMSFTVQQGTKTMRAVAWGMAERFEELSTHNGECALVVTPKINDFRGYTNVEIEVHDFQLRGVAEVG